MIVMSQNYFDWYKKMFSNWKVALFASIFHVAWTRNSHTVLKHQTLGDIINKTNLYNHDGSGWTNEIVKHVNQEYAKLLNEDVSSKCLHGKHRKLTKASTRWYRNALTKFIGRLA